MPTRAPSIAAALLLVPVAAAHALQDTSAFGAGEAGRTAVGEPLAAGAEAATLLLRAVRWLELTALVVAVGAAAVLLVALRSRAGAAEPSIARAARTRTLVATAAAALAFLGLTYARRALGGVPEGPGQGWLVGFGAATTMLLSIVSLGLRSRFAGTTLGLAAAMLAMSPPLTGHAADSGRLTAVALLADWVHVAGAAGWIGGLAVVALVLVPLVLRGPEAQRAADAAWLVDGFHRLAAPALALVLLSGVLSTGIRVGSWQALTTTNYGEVVLFKVFVVAIAALLGAFHWKRVRPRLTGPRADDPRLLASLRSTLLVEVAAGAVVVALTAVLVTSSPPR